MGKKRKKKQLRSAINGLFGGFVMMYEYLIFIT